MQRPETKKIFRLLKLLSCVPIVSGMLLTACSFNYGTAGNTENDKPDIVMENIEYVRVRGGDPLVRFKAEHAERWEDLQTMDISDFSFEQFEDHGETINAEGAAGTATVRLDSGDVSLRDGVRINIESEDIIIKTEELEWRDKEKTLTAGSEDEVEVERSDGTIFTGRGFSASARSRTWSFSGEVSGTYIEKEDEEEDQ